VHCELAAIALAADGRRVNLGTARRFGLGSVHREESSRRRDESPSGHTDRRGNRENITLRCPVRENRSSTQEARYGTQDSAANPSSEHDRSPMDRQSPVQT
jgi:hypothetical protein